MASKWKPRTQETHEGYRRLHLDEAFAGKFIDEIETGDVARWFASVGERSGPGAANRALEILKALMRKAEDWGYRAEGSNPCSGIRTNRRRRCERFLSEQELARLGAALKRAEASQPVHAAAVALILLTGCRKSEIINLRWSDVRGQRLLLEDSKTGPRTVWLGKAARKLLDRTPRKPGGDVVFPLDPLGRRHALDHFWRQLRAGAALPAVRLHDLRHSFASFAARQSETLPTIGKLLGHAKIASTARYAHLDDSSVSQAAERVGQLLRSAMHADRVQ
jgi:integrase